MLVLILLLYGSLPWTFMTLFRDGGVDKIRYYGPLISVHIDCFVFLYIAVVAIVTFASDVLFLNFNYMQ